MKYTKEITDKIVEQYKAGVPVSEIAAQYEVPDRSIIAKLSSLGIYERKTYLNKRGEVPIKKEEYIERIAELLNVQLDRLESLEKANKSVLALIDQALRQDAE